MQRRSAIAFALFLISGATGLLYEVAFSKLLGYVFGATAYAVSTVLASFMAGLALGAHVGGRYARRTPFPLAAYGVLEIAVGLVCAASPFALDALLGAYVGVARAAPDSIATLTAARAMLTSLVVVIPTLAMGATLPLLARVIVEGAGTSGARRLSQLYATNTAGGALGALLGAYAILPALGIRGTMFAAAATNVAIGLAAIAIGLRAGASPAPELGEPARRVERDEPGAATGAGTGERSAGLGAPLAVFAFGSGFLVFAAEVVETHLLALVIGNSAYAFGLMLAIFLVCLGLGAARAPAFAAAHGDAALGRGLAVTALSLGATLPLWDQLPRVFAFAGRFVTSWAGREACRALVALAILALPTLWMGTTFPILLQRAARARDVGREVGRLTLQNTLGTIAGSIVAGYVVLPALGSQRALAAVACAFAALAVLALRGSRAPATARRSALAMAALGVAFGLLLPRWNLARLTNGANVYFSHGPEPEAIEFVREDVHGGVTTVARRGSVRTMYTNGKFQGDDGPEMAAQRRFAHFPSLFVREEKRALVVGLGTGTTLGAVAAYPYERIDVAEISPAIVEAAQTYFAGPSRGALSDPRVRLHVNDGRNLLLVQTEPYDLVTIELTSVWFAGAASLYSRDFYELVASRLAEGGVLQQWVQLHHIRREELGVIVRTLRSVFPHVALFVGGSQGILVASQEPLVAREARLAALGARPELRATLETPRLSDLLSELVASGEALDRFVLESEPESGARISTDDNLYLEYATPKGNVMAYEPSLKETLETLERYRTTDVRARHLAP